MQKPARKKYSCSCSKLFSPFLKANYNKLDSAQDKTKADKSKPIEQNAAYLGANVFDRVGALGGVDLRKNLQNH